MTEPETIEEAITTVDEVDAILTSLTTNPITRHCNQQQINMWLDIRLNLMEKGKDQEL